MSKILHETELQDGSQILTAWWWWCPGCDEATRGDDSEGNGLHKFDSGRWTFVNKDEDAPTFEASYLVYGTAEPLSEEQIANGYLRQPRCHSFVRNGMIEYLSDSEHALAGQTVPMVPLPEWCP